MNVYVQIFINIRVLTLTILFWVIFHIEVLRIRHQVKERTKLNPHFLLLNSTTTRQEYRIFIYTAFPANVEISIIYSTLFSIHTLIYYLTKCENLEFYQTLVN